MVEMRTAIVMLAVLMPPAFAQARAGIGNESVQRPAASFQGTIKAVDGSKILLELPDGNIIEFRATRKSKVQVGGRNARLKDLASGQAAEIDGRYVLGVVEAVKVTAKPPGQRP
jgi:hypothetical protein